ncbi:MAG: CBS domain-containing protein [Deltaproteobacteria bacterium]|nr:CBS domain-containing protein [Deltaproteobacteria bacterium]
MIAANIMTKSVLALSPDKTVIDAMKLISQQKIRQIPVVDSDNRVLGVITPRKLMKAILPKYIAEGMVEDVRFAPELPEFSQNIDSLAFKKIDELLDRDFVSITPGTSTMEIAALFVNSKKPIESILVLDDKKRLLGIISPWDIFKKLWDYADKKRNN